jgi:hypothetical protein
MSKAKATRSFEIWTDKRGNLGSSLVSGHITGEERNMSLCLANSKSQ